MRSFDIIDKFNIIHTFTICFKYVNFNEFIVDNVCVIRIYKYHNHNYSIKCFFYDTRLIYYDRCIGSIKELYSIIKQLLYNNLYGAIQ